MTVLNHALSSKLGYHAGLDPVEEAIISSHFMQSIGQQRTFSLYDPATFSSKSLSITLDQVNCRLLPALRRETSAFAQLRADASLRRAAHNMPAYNLPVTSTPGPIEVLTEIFFDRQFRSGSKETCSRQVIRAHLLDKIARSEPIDMVVVALPYKIDTPLKARGPLPDLAEVEFLLHLTAICEALEIQYRRIRQDLRGPLARFTVISDGLRFAAITKKSPIHIEAYQHRIKEWIRLLGLDDRIFLRDYIDLLQSHLAPDIQTEKAERRLKVRKEYNNKMWPIFNPDDIRSSLIKAAVQDPDPESSNAQGRFVALLKSLIYTIHYRSMEAYTDDLPKEHFAALYREMTIRTLATNENHELALAYISPINCSSPAKSFSNCRKETLRKEMLREAWEATINYVAEIRSDRDLSCDPIVTCLPGHLRWTIHAKPGQLGLRLPHALGKPIAPWAGTAMFKRHKGNRLRLCSMPVLAQEGQGAIPVLAKSVMRTDPHQPLFYLHPDLNVSSIGAFLDLLEENLDSQRS